MDLSEEILMSLSWTHISLVVKSTLLEVQRRQDVWVLSMFMALFAVVALGARLSGDTTPATGTFMLNLGMSLAVFFAHALTVLLSVRQFPNEIEHRTVYPLLAKPLSRDSLLVGKWLACWMGGILTFLAFHLVALGVSPPAQPISGILHLQHLLVQVVSLAWAAGLGIACSLCLPRGLALGSTLICVYTGEALFRWLEDRLAIVAYVLPRFGSLNLATRLTDGIPPLGLLGMGGLLVYGSLWTLMSLALARRFWIWRSL